MSRKTEIILGSTILLLIILFFAYQILDDFLEIEDGLDRLEAAIMTGDIDYLQDHIYLEDLDRDLSEKELQDIAELLEYVSISSLWEEGRGPESNIYVIKDGREKIIFDKYKLGLRLYDLIIEENPKGTKVLINDKEVGSFEEGEDFTYQGLIPGYHKIELVYQGDFDSISQKEELVAFERGIDNKVYSTLRVDGRYVTVSSNLEEANLVVEGEDTGINIYESYEIGPLGNGEVVVSARAVIDGETYESDEYRIDEYSNSSYDLYIDYEPGLTDEEITREIEELIGGYEAGLVLGVNYGSYSYLDDYIEYGSPFMKSQKKLIYNLYENGTSEELLSYGIEDIDIKSEDEVLVTVSESHMITYKTGKKEEVNNRWTYTIVKPDNQYLIRELK